MGAWHAHENYLREGHVSEMGRRRQERGRPEGRGHNAKRGNGTAPLPKLSRHVSRTRIRTMCVSDHAVANAFACGHMSCRIRIEGAFFKRMRARVILSCEHIL